jgi:hypothetical protein
MNQGDGLESSKSWESKGSMGDQEVMSHRLSIECSGKVQKGLSHEYGIVPVIT